MNLAIYRHRSHICRALRQLSSSPVQDYASLPGHLSAIFAASSASSLCGQSLVPIQAVFSKAAPEPGIGFHKFAFHKFAQRRWAGAATQPLPPEEEIILTDNAVEKLHELCSGRQDQCLRLTVEAGGCSGFSYKFDLDSVINDGDRVFEAGGVKLVADSMSYEFIKGSKVDYSQELIKSSFEVIDNPNADKGCGCGTSFSPK